MEEEHLNECQIVCLPRIATGSIRWERQSLVSQLKRLLAKPWNYTIKNRLKKMSKWLPFQSNHRSSAVISIPVAQVQHLQAGDRVRVRSREEIQLLLDRWNEYHGCAFLESMWQYCGTEQRVFRVVERFLDERDYQVKKARGLVLLEGVFCEGTPVFGRCDRSCMLFWREEWLEKIG